MSEWRMTKSCRYSVWDGTSKFLTRDDVGDWILDANEFAFEFRSAQQCESLIRRLTRAGGRFRDQHLEIYDRGPEYS